MEPGPRLVQALIRPSALASWAVALVLTGCATEIGIAATAHDALQRGFVVTVPPDSQAGASMIGEQVTLLALSTMPPFEPRYLRQAA